MTSQEIVQSLNNIGNSSDFPQESGKLVSEWIRYPDRLVFMGVILRFMEDNPDLEYGTPGPVIHFMEEIDGPEYGRVLSQSIERKPIFQNVWMMNRLLNGMSSNERKGDYITVLKRANDRLSVDDNLARQITRFIRIHE